VWKRGGENKGGEESEAILVFLSALVLIAFLTPTAPPKRIV
jgi:hypothetical protein